MMSRKRNAALLSLALALSARGEAAPRNDSPGEDSPPAGWRIHRSTTPEGTKTHVVVPGERFRAGPLKRWLYGSDYRDLWTTPIEVEVLDLDSVGGGLTPLRTGGFGQSISLHFTGEDGRRYTVRSLDKDPTKSPVAHKGPVPPPWVPAQERAVLPQLGDAHLSEVRYRPSQRGQRREVTGPAVTMCSTLSRLERMKAGMDRERRDLGALKARAGRKRE